MVRFIHTADWQLGESFARFGEDGTRLKDARFGAVRRIAELANEHQVDFVVVAGDVFDDLRPSREVLYRALHEMAAFSGHWFLMPGNHDYVEPHGLWEQLASLPTFRDSVHLLLEPTPHPLPELGAALLPAPLHSRAPGQDVTSELDTMATEEGWIRIGVAHGSVLGVLPADAASHNPIAADRATRARLAYLALGDWHGRYQVDGRTWYSGTPEPDGFVSNDPGSVLLVEVDGPEAQPHVDVLMTKSFTWHRLDRELAGESDVGELRHRLRSFQRTDVVACEVTGIAGLADRVRLEELVDEVRARVGALQFDMSTLQAEPTEEDMAALERRGLAGAVLRRLRERVDLDPAVRQAAMRELWRLTA